MFPLDSLYKEAKGMPLVLDLHCEVCNRVTKHYFSSYQADLVYECFRCDQFKTLDPKQFIIEENDSIY